jgi:predicted transcriptional regulator
MSVKTASIRMDDEKLARIDNIAKAMNRSRAWVINKAIEQYLDYEEWFIQQVQEGLKEAEAGNLLDHAEVAKKWEAKLEAKMDAHRKPRSRRH